MAKNDVSNESRRNLLKSCRLLTPSEFQTRFVSNIKRRSRVAVELQKPRSGVSAKTKKQFQQLINHFGATPRHPSLVFQRFIEVADEVDDDSTRERVLRELNRALADATLNRFRFMRLKHLSSTSRSKIQAVGSNASFSFSEFDAFLVEDLDVRSLKLRVGFMHYPPYCDMREGLPTGVIGRIFQLLCLNSDIDCEPINVSLEDGLDLLKRPTSDSRHLDALFGIFDSPQRAAKDYVYTAPIHLVSLVGVTSQDTKINTFDQITSDASIEVFCVKGEVGHEFADRSLDIQPRIVPRLSIQSHERIGDVLTTFLKSDAEGADRRIAFLDGVSASTFINSKQANKAKVQIKFNQLAWYSSGILLRPEIAEEAKARWLADFTSVRMAVWNETGEDCEQNQMSSFWFPNNPERDLVRPVLYPSAGMLEH